MASQEIADLLLNTLNAYGANFGVPQSTDDVRAISHAILNLHQPHDSPLTPDGQTSLIEQVVKQFDPSQPITAITDSAAIALAHQVHQRQADLESQVLNSLTAYVQNHVSNSEEFNLPDTILAIVPLVSDGQISRPEVNALIHRISQTFTIQSAIAQVLPPAITAIANQIATTAATILHYGQLNHLVQETVIAYLSNSQSGLTHITNSLIQTALAKVLESGLGQQLGLSSAPNLDQQSALVKQVSFKLTIMQADPKPSRTAEDIAAGMAAEIEQFQRDRHQQLGNANALQPTLLGDLEVGIPIYHVEPNT